MHPRCAGRIIPAVCRAYSGSRRPSAGGFAGNAAAQAVLHCTAKPDDRGLSPRELEIAQLAAARRTNAEIAAQLHLSEATVKNHLKRIFDKLGLDGGARGKRNLLADMLPEKISP